MPGAHYRDPHDPRTLKRQATREIPALSQYVATKFPVPSFPPYTCPTLTWLHFLSLHSSSNLFLSVLLLSIMLKSRTRPFLLTLAQYLLTFYFLTSPKRTTNYLPYSNHRNILVRSILIPPLLFPPYNCRAITWVFFPYFCVPHHCSNIFSPPGRLDTPHTSTFCFHYTPVHSLPPYTCPAIHIASFPYICVPRWNMPIFSLPYMSAKH